MSRYFCYQGNNNDCGFASLKMLLATLNHNPSFLRLRNVKHNESYSFADLIDIAKQYGVTLSAYKCVCKNIECIKVPSLALIDQNHLVLIKKVTAKRILLSDPTRGIIRLKTSEFITRWGGELLEVDEHEKSTLKLKNHFLLSPISQIISYVLTTLGVASLIVGLYFIKDDSFIFIPFILFISFITLELVEKWYLIKEIIFFDNMYIPKYFANSNTVKIDYKNYTSFKLSYFSFSRKLFSTLLIASIIVLTLIINDPRNAIAILSIVSICSLEKLLFNKRDFAKKNNMAILEDKLINETNPNLTNDIKHICSCSSNFALNISLRKCINTFIVIITSFLLMLFANEVSVNYVIFHFGLYYVLINNFDYLLDADWRFSEYKKEKARFIDKCNL